MSTGLEVAAAIIALLQISKSLHKGCKKYFRAGRKLTKEAKHLKNTVTWFSEILELFCTTFKNLQTKRLPLVSDPKVTKTIKRLKETAREAQGQTLKSFGRIHHLGRPGSSLIERSKAKINWILRDEQCIRELILKLNAEKIDISLLINILSLNLNFMLSEEQRAKGQSPSQELLSQLKFLTRQNKNLKVMVQDARQEIRELRGSQGLDSAVDSGGLDASDSFSYDVQELCRSQQPIRTKARRSVREAEINSPMSIVATSDSRGTDQPQQPQSVSNFSIDRVARDFNNVDTPPLTGDSTETSAQSLDMVPETSSINVPTEDMPDEESPATSPDQDNDCLDGDADVGDCCTDDYPRCRYRICTSSKGHDPRRSQPYRLINRDGNLQHRESSPGPA